MGIIAGLPALLGIPGGRVGADFAEDLFFLWEKLSEALVGLFPGRVADAWLLSGLGALTLVLLGGRVLELSPGRTLFLGAVTLAFLGVGGL